MTDENDNDTGRPVLELAALEREGSVGFLGRVRRRIQRRRIATGVLQGTWSVTGAVLLEFVNLVFLLFGGGSGKGGQA